MAAPQTPTPSEPLKTPKRRRDTKAAFWESLPALWPHRRLIGVGMVGAMISAACFGVGIGMVLPIFNLLIQNTGNPRAQFQEWLADPERSQWVVQVLQPVGEQIPEHRFWAFAMAMGVVVVLSIVGSAGRFIHELFVITAISRTSMDWRSKLYSRVIHAQMSTVLRGGTADNIIRIVADTRIMANGYQAILSKSVHKLLSGTAALLVAFIVDWRLTLLVLIGLPIVALALRKFGKTIRRATRQALQERGKMLSIISQSLAGIRVVKVHNAEGYERLRLQKANRAIFQQEIRMRRAKALSSPVVETLGLFGIIAVALVAAGLIVYRNQSPEHFFTVLVALIAAAATLRPLAALNATFNEAGAAALRIMQLIDLPVEAVGPYAEPGHTKLARHAESVTFENVSYTYPDQETPAVNNVSLAVKHGETVAVVGMNGSGKTTLLSLLPRLLDADAGRVLIDGVDINTVSLRSLRQQMAVVTQQSVLFEGTIADNIAYGTRDATQEQIEAAAKEAFADEFIRQRPKGYDDMINEAGEGLSGGQKQRLCIARAILRQPVILILDEATSQIDADSEAKINKALRRFTEARTTFVIAHRLSTVIDADRIVVMDAGRIIDQGKHAELLERCDIYRTLTRAQMAG